MSVQVRQEQIRKSPSFLADITGKLTYGDRVSVLMEKDAWVKIQHFNTGSSGWMHISALTVKEIVLKAGAKDAPLSANSDEYALAGKGFNKQVENQYSANNPNLDFTWINTMETFTVSPRQMQQFLIAGQVVSNGGEG